MSTTYRTRAGDVLDWVCWQHYQTQVGTVEAVLSANQGLADYGPILPSNLVIVMPDVEPPKAGVDSSSTSSTSSTSSVVDSDSSSGVDSDTALRLWD